MNSDILKGKWNQIKGDVKKRFGKLTDDDMMQIEGDTTKAAGIIQERYGYTREEAEKHWKSFTSNLTGAVASVTEDVKDAVEAKVAKSKD